MNSDFQYKTIITRKNSGLKQQVGIRFAYFHMYKTFSKSLGRNTIAVRMKKTELISKKHNSLFHESYFNLIKFACQYR